METQIEVTKETYDLLVERVRKNHENISTLQVGIGSTRSAGGTKTGDPESEFELEQSFQIILRQSKELLKKCVIAPAPRNNKTVQVGSRVKISIGENITEFIFDGLSLSKGFCSSSSPLGKRLSGSKVGESFVFAHRGVEQRVKVISIS